MATGAATGAAGEAAAAAAAVTLTMFGCKLLVAQEVGVMVVVAKVC